MGIGRIDKDHIQKRFTILISKFCRKYIRPSND